ncbi:MAG TPA: hypothetical protein VFB84_20915 [Micromonosporaceae bacterium]|nr:hypothetical protein [Micromonosporaceae bacterium]
MSTHHPSTTEAVHDAIMAATAAGSEDMAGWYAQLGRLWREMARTAGREHAPGWAQLAAALLADDYDRRARAAGPAANPTTRLDPSGKDRHGR